MSDQTQTVFDELPALESVVTMTATEKAEWQAKLDAALTEQGLTYQKAEKQYQEAKAAYDQAYAAFERDHAVLIETRKTAAQQADQLKAQLQRWAAFRRALTGVASWQAFQAAETWKPVFNDNAMLTWIIDEAPRATALTLLALNKTAVNKFVTSRREEGRSTVKPLEGCTAIPATCEAEITGKILADKLPLLVPPPQPEPPPVAYIATLTSPEPTIISSDTATEPLTGWWLDLDTNQVEYKTYTTNQRKDRRLSGPYETQIEAQTAAVLF